MIICHLLLDEFLESFEIGKENWFLAFSSLKLSDENEIHFTLLINQQLRLADDGEDWSSLFIWDLMALFLQNWFPPLTKALQSAVD